MICILRKKGSGIKPGTVHFLHGQGLAVGIGLVSVLLLASATALMYRPPSNVYFKSPKWV